VVHCGYTARGSSDGYDDMATIRTIYGLGFAGISLDLSVIEHSYYGDTVRILSLTEGMPLLAINCSTCGKKIVSYDLGKERPVIMQGDVVEIRIPHTMRPDQVREKLAGLPLCTKMIVHSSDAAGLVGASRDVVELKYYALLFDVLVNFGDRTIATPEAAYTLAYMVPLAGVVAENSALREQQHYALRAGDL
jgi:hypothetical protein